jgi:hypothetical protein
MKKIRLVGRRSKSFRLYLSVCACVCARVSSCVSRRRLFSLVSSADLFAWSIDGEFSSRSQKVRWETIRCSILRLVLDSFSLGKFSFFFVFFFSSSFPLEMEADPSKERKTLFFFVCLVHTHQDFLPVFVFLPGPGSKWTMMSKTSGRLNWIGRIFFFFFNPPAYSSFFFLLNVGQGPRKE